MVAFLLFSQFLIVSTDTVKASAKSSWLKDSSLRIRFNEPAKTALATSLSSVSVSYVTPFLWLVNFSNSVIRYAITPAISPYSLMIKYQIKKMAKKKCNKLHPIKINKCTRVAGTNLDQPAKCLDNFGLTQSNGYIVLGRMKNEGHQRKLASTQPKSGKSGQTVVINNESKLQWMLTKHIKNLPVLPGLRAPSEPIL